jgi:hypothetical protein
LVCAQVFTECIGQDAERCTAPGIEPDLDDSAKASIILSLLGEDGFAHAIVEEFDGLQCLRTYQGERDPSVSANCNALMSVLLDGSDFPSKTATMEKIITFLYDVWVSNKGKIEDKWVIFVSSWIGMEADATPESLALLPVHAHFTGTDGVSITMADELRSSKAGCLGHV